MELNTCTCTCMLSTCGISETVSMDCQESLNINQFIKSSASWTQILDEALGVDVLYLDY